MSHRISFYILLNFLVLGSCHERYKIIDEWMKDAEPVSKDEIDKKGNQILAEINKITNSIGDLETKILDLKNNSFPTEVQNFTGGTSMMVNLSQGQLEDQPVHEDDPRSTVENAVNGMTNLKMEKEILEEQKEKLESLYKKALQVESNNLKEGINGKNHITFHRNNISITLDVPCGKTTLMFEDESPGLEECDNQSNGSVNCNDLTKIHVNQNSFTLFQLEQRNFTGHPMYVRSSQNCGTEYEFATGKLILSDHDGSWHQSKYRVYANNTVLIKDYVQLTPDGILEIHQVIDKIQEDVFSRIYSEYIRVHTGWEIRSQTAQSIDLKDPQKLVHLQTPCQDSLIIKRYTEEGDFLSKKTLVCNKH